MVWSPITCTIIISLLTRHDLLVHVLSGFNGYECDVCMRLPFSTLVYLSVNVLLHVLHTRPIMFVST